MEGCAGEMGSPERLNGEAAAGGRPYGCMFCKRGFSSAQALGGHMNVHRRDRTRIHRPAGDPPATGPPRSPARFSPAPPANRRRELSLLGGYLQLGLPAQEDDGRQRRPEDEPGGGLDLELRLGHDPKSRAELS